MDAKCRDKFLVQSVIISGDQEFNNVQTIVSSTDIRHQRPVAREYSQL